MNYFKYSFTPKSENLGLDAIVGILSELPFESFIEHENSLIAYLSEKESVDKEHLNTLFKDIGHDVLIEKSLIEDQNWNAKWESDYPVVELGSDLIVRAPFHQINTDHYGIDIQIQPKMSFGTGHHETTFMMLKYILESDVSNKSVLDMGSGTGVLAIAAKKLGAKHVKAVDIEEWAYENTLENIELNSTQVDVDKGDMTRVTGEKFDYILANINKNVLLSDMKNYAEALNNKGSLYLSGFFGTDVDEIVKHANSEKMDFQSKKQKGDWAAIHLKKTN